MTGNQKTIRGKKQARQLDWKSKKGQNQRGARGGGKEGINGQGREREREKQDIIAAVLVREKAKKKKKDKTCRQ